MVGARPKRTFAEAMSLFMNSEDFSKRQFTKGTVSCSSASGPEPSQRRVLDQYVAFVVLFR